MRRAKKRVVGSRRMWVNSLRATGARPKKELLCAGGESSGWLGGMFMDCLPVVQVVSARRVVGM
jgi:hypothetical protein